ncbi:sugar kinase [Saccharospirillum mangrovi]|uniref:sugar kinase n=1 Tax=Saccharospirillum mangrovi TaxID=2161747 RepID=UPI000D3D5D2B|nr:sugar kinase [Saccharospirillum mangrovi]
MSTESSRTAPEILCFGEPMALYVAQTPGDLATVDQFQRRLAGADNNVAIGLSRLGFSVQWLSRVGDDSLGRFVRASLTAEGIDCRAMLTDSSHPTGLMFKEKALEGRDPKVEYFRRGSAASQMSPADAERLDLSNLRHLHLTGITPALSAGCLALSETLIAKARAAGASISFDPNLRPSLWPSEAVMRDTLNALARQVDWVLPGIAEGRLLTRRDDPAAIADFYLDGGAKAVVLKLGPEGSLYRGTLTGSIEQRFQAGEVVAEVVDTVGAGDAFAVGVISALLEGRSVEQALQRGNRLGARAIQVEGDMESLPNRTTLTAMEA